MRLAEIEDYNWVQDDDRTEVNPLPVITSVGSFTMMSDVDSQLVDNSSIGTNLTGRNYGKALFKLRDAIGKIEDVRIDNIICSEKYLNRDHLEAIINGESKKSSGDFPIFYRYKEKYYAGDGNHRIVGAHFKGETTVRGLVLDADKILGADYEIEESSNGIL